MEMPAASAQQSPASQPTRKRPAPSPDQTSQRRTRGTYTSVACDNCKKRKLKCIPTEDRRSCERCIEKRLPCQYTYAHDSSQAGKRKADSCRQCTAVATELAQLRHELSGLSDYVKTIGGHMGLSLSRDDGVKTVPQQPQFVGPTRPAAGLILGQDSLTNMGILPVEEPSSSRSESSPAPETSARGARGADLGFWQTCTVAEISRILHVVQEELLDMFPFFVTADVIAQVPDILRVIRTEEAGRRPAFSRPDKYSDKIDRRDVDFLKVAVCFGLNFEAGGSTEMSRMTVRAIENEAARITGPEVALKQVQLLLLLSLFYFHCDGELLAWRTVGVGSRAALEMGLHRRSSLDEMFKDMPTRDLAIRVFWCLYYFDRRFAYGTGLSWVLPSGDIDPNLPRPSPDYPFLNSIIRYTETMCTAMWGAIPPFRSPFATIARETVESLDQRLLGWIETIPPQLQLLHPRQRPGPQPSSLHRLRALLYLRGNHTRILIYRHFLFSAARIADDLMSANLAVDIAKDTIEVLVHLNATTKIYSRQQTTFNYFLVSALSAIVLAVCHAPKIFKASCKDSFTDAVEIIRSFNGHHDASKRLWRTIRGLLPRLRKLDPQCPEGPSIQAVGGVPDARAKMERAPAAVNPNDGLPWATSSDYTPSMIEGSSTESVPATGMTYDESYDVSVPDFMQMGDNLMDLFNVFGQMGRSMGLPDKAPNAPLMQEQVDMPDWEGNDMTLFPGFV